MTMVLGATVKPGYKLTEVGVIPEDWEVRSIGQMFQLVNGCAFKPEDWKQSGIPIIRIQNLNDPFASFNFSQAPVSEKNRVEAGDLLFAWSGTIGTSFGARVWAGPSGVLNQHIFKVFVEEQQITLPFSLLVFARVEEDIAKQAHGFKASFVHVKKSDLVKVSLPVPPIPEQRAIAAALSDADALLVGLDRLIAKKRDLKQAAMQQLLSGQIRSPGFHGDWEKRTLEASAHCLDHVRVPLNESQRAAMKGDYPYCGANGVLDYVDSYVIDDDIILMAEDGGYFDEYETRPIAYRMSGKCWVNNHAHVLKAKPDVDQGFLYYSLVHKNILPFLASGTRAKLNRSEMNKIELLCPRDKEEQSAIATVLSNMDAELSALEARRDKTQALKQAMMQELLTGRIRLI